MHPLITVDELAASVGARVCDLRWDLTDSEKGRASYEAGHIPGAVFVDLDDDLAGPPGIDGRHPLPSVSDFAATLGRLGITPSDHVVVYDDVGGRVAARMWWMLHSIGHAKVQLLDGGYQAWVNAGHHVDTAWIEPHPVTYPAPEAWDGVISSAEIGDITLVDARAPARYRGEIEPIDPKAGHIPGAINLPSDDNLDDDGLFLDAESLAARYEGLPDGVAVSCGSGVTACHNALAMVIAGRQMPMVYVGSFSEWSRRGLPVSQGPHP